MSAHCRGGGKEVGFGVPQTTLRLSRAKTWVSAYLNPPYGTQDTADTAVAHGLPRLHYDVPFVEAVGFEWFGSADHPRFKEFSKLVQERANDIKGMKV